VLVLIAIWYVAAIAMNLSLVRDAFEREETAYALTDMISGTLSAKRPLLPRAAPGGCRRLRFRLGYSPLAPRSLVYHSLVTLTATLLGFVLGALLGIVLALMIVHSRVLERSLMPWNHLFADGADTCACADLYRGAGSPRSARIIAEIDHLGLSLLFFRSAIGMVKGLTSPEPLHIELMRTWSATSRQMLWKLRWPSAVPYLFASLRVAIHDLADRRDCRRICRPARKPE